MLARARQTLRLHPGHGLIAVFTLTILLPGILLAFLGFRAFRQERRLADQQIRDRLERVAEFAVRDLEQELREWQRAVEQISPGRTRDTGDLPERIRRAVSEQSSAAVIVLEQQRARVIPENALLYQVGSIEGPLPSRALPGLLSDAETQELREKNYARAIELYSEALHRAQPAWRPLVLQRLARTYRKQGKTGDALRVYGELARMADARIGDLPAGLVAGYELCELQRQRGSASGMLDFYRDLVGGRWLLEKSRYLFYSQSVRQWLTGEAASAGEAASLRKAEQQKLSLTRAVEGLLEAPRRFFLSDTATHLAFWRSDPFAAIVLTEDFLTKRVWPQAFSSIADQNLGITLLDANGHALFGSSPAVKPRLSGARILQDGDFIWRLQVWPRDPQLLYADLAQRQTLYLGMLLLLVMLLIFGGYITARTVRRELEIARLKSDFVSAVSHEFRSPLTGVHQLGEMLMRGRVKDEQRRQEYYRLITKESDRLARLVGNLLDFSRMEEGRKEYRFEPLEPAGWLRTLAAEFESESADKEVDISVAVPGNLPTLLADREALTCAVHNLLDNAVKYSPDSKTVWLEAEAADGQISIRVRDLGRGIAEQDRKHIFEKFYRGGGKSSEQVKGAGLGLSLVKHIIEAHGGTVECQSRPGEGSTFTIHLKAHREEHGTHPRRGR